MAICFSNSAITWHYRNNGFLLVHTCIKRVTIHKNIFSQGSKLVCWCGLSVVVDLIEQFSCFSKKYIFWARKHVKKKTGKNVNQENLKQRKWNKRFYRILTVHLSACLSDDASAMGRHHCFRQSPLHSGLVAHADKTRVLTGSSFRGKGGILSTTLSSRGVHYTARDVRMSSPESDSVRSRLWTWCVDGWCVTTKALVDSVCTLISEGVHFNQLDKQCW